MGVVSLIENTSDSSSSYFRHLGITLAIRDLWTKLELAFLKETLKVEAANVNDADAKTAVGDRVIALAEAFCNDLGKLVSDELGEWQTEFSASLSELEAHAKKSSEVISNCQWVELKPGIQSLSLRLK